MKDFEKYLIEKYENYVIPIDTTISQIIERLGLYFTFENVVITSAEVKSYVSMFKKNVLFSIYRNEYEKCSTIDEILMVEQKHNENEIENRYISCFKLLPKSKNNSLNSKIQDEVYLLVSFRYDYVESNNSVINAFIVKWRGVKKEDILNKTEEYFAYLDVLKRLDEDNFLKMDY